MPTQNLLRLLLLLVLVMRIVADLETEVWSTFVQTLSTRFVQDFEVEVKA